MGESYRKMTKYNLLTIQPTLAELLKRHGNFENALDTCDQIAIQSPQSTFCSVGLREHLTDKKLTNIVALGLLFLLVCLSFCTVCRICLPSNISVGSFVSG